MKTVYLLYPSKLLETMTAVDAVAQVLLVFLDQQSLFGFQKCLFFSSHIEGWNFIWGLTNPSLIRLFLLSLYVPHSSTSSNNINSWGRYLLDGNHLKILSRGIGSFLNLS